MTKKKKKKKKYWLKWNALKMSPKKRTLDQNINYSKFHIWNSFFENIILGIHNFYIRPHVPVDMIRVFSYFRFSSRKSQSQQKLVKKITPFTIKFCSKIPTHFMNLNSLDIENDMFPQHSQKPFWLYKFSSKHVSASCQKNIFTAPFLEKQMSVYLCISP